MKSNHYLLSILVFQIILLLLPCMTFAQYRDHRAFIHEIDSLEQILATNQPEGLELRTIYGRLMTAYLHINNEKSMEYARKRIALSIPLNLWNNLIGSYHILGDNYCGISQYDSAMFYYDKALEAVERLKDFPEKYTEINIDDGYSKIYGAIGNLCNVQGKYLEAIDYYTKAMKIFEKHDWKESQAVAYYNIGEMYRSMENYPQAEINYLKMDSLAYITADSLFIAGSKWSLGYLYLHTKNFADALRNAAIAYDYYFSHTEEGPGKVETLNLLSEIYLEGYGDDLQAETYIRQALELLNQTDMPRDKAISLRVLSSVYLKRRQWRQAEQSALDALATDDSEPSNTLLLYEILAKSYTHQENATKAIEYFDKHNTLQSTWSTKNYQSAIREMEVKYETGKKETQIAALETENRLLAAERRLLTGLGIAVTFGLFLFVAVLIFRQKNLAIQKKLAEESVKRLEEQRQLELAEAALEGELTERRRIARDLHDGLGGMLAAVKINMQNVKPDTNGDTSNYDRAFDLLDGSMKELRRLAHHLMPDALVHYGLKTSLEVFCQSLPNVRFHYFGEDIRIDSKLETLLYRSAYELIYNAVKHAEATQTNVQLVQEPDRISLTVQDNGKGFDVSQETNGMGLNNIRKRVAVFNGEFNVSSEPGNGTEISVELRIEN